MHGTPLFTFRLPRTVQQILAEQAAEAGVTPRAYARSIKVTNLAMLRSENMIVQHSVRHVDFSSLDRAIKRFILAAQNPITVAASLPAKARRNSLEELSWDAVLEAVEFAKSQRDSELRLLAMRIVSGIIRTELAVLHEQDQAEVDEVITEVEAWRRELAKKARESARDTART